MRAMFLLIAIDVKRSGFFATQLITIEQKLEYVFPVRFIFGNKCSWVVAIRCLLANIHCFVQRFIAAFIPFQSLARATLQLTRKTHTRHSSKRIRNRIELKLKTKIISNQLMCDKYKFRLETLSSVNLNIHLIRLLAYTLHVRCFCIVVSLAIIISSLSFRSLAL